MNDHETHGIEYFYQNSDIIAIVIRSIANSSKLNFFTPEHFPLQVGLMTRKKDEIIEPHVHNKITREIADTFEVLVIREGNCKIKLFGENNNLLYTVSISTGDTILLGSCGHSLEMLSECKMLEVKQGPYLGAMDKKHFNDSR